MLGVVCEGGGGYVWKGVWVVKVSGERLGGL